MATGGQHPVLVLMILAVWLAGLLVSRRMLRSLGVTSWAGQITLASIPPTAVLIAVLHVLGLYSLTTSSRCVIPTVILPSFAIALALLLPSWRLGLSADRRGTTAHQTNRAAICRPGHTPHGRIRALLIPLLAVAGSHAVFLTDAVSRYPTGCDALNYHLPAAARWVQDGQLSLNVDDWRLSMAANGELPSMLLLSGGFERLLPILPVPFGLLAATTVYELTRRWGGDRRGAICAALLVLGAPIVIHHMYVNYVDLFGTSIWLTSILAITWAQRLSGRNRIRLWVIAGLAAGIAAGTRLTFQVFAALSGVVLVASVVTVRQPARIGEAARAAVWFSLATAICCWFWPLRGALMMGNALHPIDHRDGQLTIGNVPIDQIYGRSAAGEWLASRPLPARLLAALEMPWREHQYGTGYSYSVDGGTGAAYAALVPVGLLSLIVRAVRKRATSAATRWHLLAGGLLAAGFLLHVTVFRMYTRYSLGFVVLAIPLAAVWSGRLIAAWPRAVPVMLGLAFGITGGMAAIEPARDFAGRLIHRQWSRSAYYGIPTMLDDLPAGTVVVNAGGTPNNYALLGRHLTNRVITAVEWQTWIQSGHPMQDLLRMNHVGYLYVSGRLPPARGAAPPYWPADLPVSCVFETRRGGSVPDNMITRVFRVEPGIHGVAVR
ncbi:MAG TPA: hypothetical protein PLL20_04260 [Phycisphaerae bacterium]|nr:hypothetical protein [Phycisphaerae bacterium]